MHSILEWIKTNWNEETHLGQAKLAALAALIFLLIASLLPDYGHAPAVPVPAATVEGGEAVARQAAAAESSAAARVAELERAHQALREQLAAKDRRIAELEQGAAGEDAALGTLELRLQLEAMRATLDQLLKRLE
ncbi:MAG: hypothetical protein ABR553_07710 [Gammaproteobacteria bacterium]